MALKHVKVKIEEWTPDILLAYQAERSTKKLTATDARMPLAARSEDKGTPRSQPKKYKMIKPSNDGKWNFCVTLPAY